MELPIAAVVLADTDRSLTSPLNGNIRAVREILTFRVCQSAEHHQFSKGLFAGMLFAIYGFASCDVWVRLH